jgi:hypothetical protein
VSYWLYSYRGGRVIEFSDILYGRIELPDWIEPFLHLPEFVRLRGVRLSNVDSYQFKDFNGPTRWDHGVAVAALAIRCAKTGGLSETDTVHLALAGLLHDVATPPFGHTAEYVLDNFDHELETQRLLTSVASEHTAPDMPIYMSELPRFRIACRLLSKKLGVPVDADEIARMVTGEGERGYLVAGTLDLDNADNVTRACLYLGLEVDRSVPLRLAEWLAGQSSRPMNLSEIDNPAVQQWVRYRSELYRIFFESSDRELGRQAFLQHLIRRTLLTNISRRQIVWNTDEGLLAAMASVDDDSREWPGLSEMVQRYRLMENTYKVLEIGIDDEDTLRALRLPQAAMWIEQQLSTPELEPFVFVYARRFGGSSQATDLLPPALGVLSVHKLGGEPHYFHFPEWIRAGLPHKIEGKRLRSAIHEVVRRKIPDWVKTRPWLTRTARRDQSAIANLNAVGDWGFRLSKNEGIHAYPATFVHAIPAALINALGLKGELIVDAFGGTGQTAVEVIKSGGRAVSADSNSIATLAARARLTYLSVKERNSLRAISSERLSKARIVEAPKFHLINKWHHRQTIEEICRVKGLIEGQRSDNVKQFLTACLSAILPATTARRGKEHGFFADNTPLSKSQSSPPYQDVFELFTQKIQRNLDIIERLYAFIEANDRSAQHEMERARVVRLDARRAMPEEYGVLAGSVDGIITSPPYLCMADYTLGQRLSYYWLCQSSLEADFSDELGARRLRSNPGQAREKYWEGLSAFAEKAALLLRKGGYLATVLGAPVATAFVDTGDIHDSYDKVLEARGFTQLWKHWRAIHWHRNHGYQRLQRERISVHIFDA